MSLRPLATGVGHVPLLRGRMPVVNSDLAQVDLFILVLAVKAGIEFIDEQVLVLLLFGLVKREDQRGKQDQVGKHGDYQGG